MLSIPTWFQNEENSSCVYRHGCRMERSHVQYTDMVAKHKELMMRIQAWFKNEENSR